MNLPTRTYRMTARAAAVEETRRRVLDAAVALHLRRLWGGTHSDRELIATFGDRGAGRDLRAELDRRPALETAVVGPVHPKNG